MTHAAGCFRSDGDWFCAKGCTHDKDARAARERGARLDEQNVNELLRTENATLRAALVEREWDDADDEWTERIRAAFPTRSGSHDEYQAAMRMVSSRHSKASLVALVNWLLVELATLADAAETKKEPDTEIAAARAILAEAQRSTGPAPSEKT